MNELYLVASRVPRQVYLVLALTLYALMLLLGATETAVSALPGRADYSKLYHVAFYAGLASLLWFSFRKASLSGVTCLIAVAGALDELHQHFLVFRQAHGTDVLIDVAAGLFAVSILRHRRQQVARSWTQLSCLHIDFLQK